MSDADLPRDLADRIIRRTLPHPPHLRAFLRQAVPDLADGFDCDRARPLDREFVLKGWRGREADLPFEIPYRTAAAEVRALVCVFIEHQSDTDPLMPLRMLYFVVAYWMNQRDEWEKLPRPRPPFRLRPVLPVVLYTGATPWGQQPHHPRPAGRAAGVPCFRSRVGAAILEPGGPHAGGAAEGRRLLAEADGGHAGDHPADP